MKLLFDFLPIVLFFATFKLAEGHRDAAAEFMNSPFGNLFHGGVVGASEAPVLLATLVVIIATGSQVAWLKSRGRKVEAMLWVSLALVVVLGGLTLWFRNDTFIKWKPSVLYWAMGVAFWLSPILFNRNLPKALLGAHFDPPAWVWLRLNLFWIAFFSGMGLLNLWVAYSLGTEAWVTYKLFGGMGLMFVFMLAQAVYLARYARDETATGADADIDAAPKSPTAVKAEGTR